MSSLGFFHLIRFYYTMPKENKFTRLMLKKAEFQNFLGITQPQDVLRETWPVLPHHLLHPQSLSSMKPSSGNHPLIPGPE